jgi:16S rRNA (guanine527-N7)-methyltransferase
MNKETFIENISKLNIPYTSNMLEQLDKYYQILITENEKYNLTAITNKEEVYLKHFYDSLTITKIIDLNNQTLCDIGTGAGFPGLVLKIFYPNLDITLIEATGKRCNFLNKVITELNLKKIKVINERAEDYSKNNREIYDIITARAVAPLSHLLEYSIPALKVNGYFIPMKGNIKEELSTINNYYQKLNIKLLEKIEFTLPQEDSTRTLLKFQKLTPTSKQFPRKYNEIKKRPL